MIKLQRGKLLKIICIMGLVMSIIFSMIGCKKQIEDEGIDDEFTPSSGIVLSKEEAEELKKKVKIITYFVSEDLSKLEGEVRYMEIEEAKQSIENIATAIVTELLKGPSQDFSGKRVIPEGTKLLEPVKITGTLATVNLSVEFIDNSSDERKNVEMSIYSMINSVTEIKELDRVKILIDGMEITTLKGIVDMSMPFKRNKDLISVNTVEASAIVEHEEELLE